MKEPSSAILRQRRRRVLAALRPLTAVIAGSFFVRQVGGVPRLCLARMCGRQQRQVYVAAAYGAAVKQGVAQYRRALGLLRELGEINLQLLRREGNLPADE